MVSIKKQMWHKKKGYRSYGIRKLDKEGLIEKYLNIFKQLRPEERFRLVRRFYKSGFSEQTGFGEAIIELSLENITPAHFDFLDEIADYFNNWAATD